MQVRGVGRRGREPRRAVRVTGRFEMSMFQTFDAGKTVHGVPGTAAPDGAPNSATSASEAATASVRRRILGANHRLQVPRYRQGGSSVVRVHPHVDDRDRGAPQGVPPAPRWPHGRGRRARPRASPRAGCSASSGRTAPARRRRSAACSGWCGRARAGCPLLGADVATRAAQRDRPRRLRSSRRPRCSRGSPAAGTSRSSRASTAIGRCRDRRVARTGRAARSREGHGQDVLARDEAAAGDRRGAAAVTPRC